MAEDIAKAAKENFKRELEVRNYPGTRGGVNFKGLY